MIGNSGLLQQQGGLRNLCPLSMVATFGSLGPWPKRQRPFFSDSPVPCFLPTPELPLRRTTLFVSFSRECHPWECIYSYNPHQATPIIFLPLVAKLRCKRAKNRKILKTAKKRLSLEQIGGSCKPSMYNFAMIWYDFTLPTIPKTNWRLLAVTFRWYRLLLALLGSFWASISQPYQDMFVGFQPSNSIKIWVGIKRNPELIGLVSSH